MMKLITRLCVGAALFGSVAAHAEVSLKSEQDVLGKWNLYAEAAALDKEKTALSVIWDFKKGGVLSTESEDRVGRTKTLKVDLKYAIEDGVLKKQSTPGRAKMESCRAIEFDGKDMVLKCTYLYFFLKR